MSNGYYFLGKDWLETAKTWKKGKQHTPPVMITVASTTHTAARVEYAFTHKRINIDELCDGDTILHIASKVLEEAEERDEPPVQLGLQAANPDKADSPGEENGGDDSNGDQPRKNVSKTEQAELLRREVDTVGQKGEPGEKIQNVQEDQVCLPQVMADLLELSHSLRGFLSLAPELSIFPQSNRNSG